MRLTSLKDFPSPEVSWIHRVSYGETDAMGVVYYGNYLHWFEQARGHFIRELGMSYAEIEARGLFLPVTEAHCNYLFPATYDQQIRVRTGICKWGRASMIFCYQLYNLSADKRLMSTGYTRHACLDPQGRTVKVPDWLKDLFRS